jgi:hypothetical protein
MIINGITISEKKLDGCRSIISENSLRHEYEFLGHTDKEISKIYDLSTSWICKLRKIYDIKTSSEYQLHRNPLRLVSLSGYQKEVLHGSLFGDSCIALQDSGSGYWKCTHCMKQEGYLLKMTEIFAPFVAKIFYGERPYEEEGELFPFVSARSYSLPQFTEYRTLFYPHGEKDLRAELMEKISPIGFAYWFMDDGSTNGYGFDITTFSSFFRLKEARDMFNDILGLKVSIIWGGEEGRIHVFKESHDLAYEYINPELPECLLYKLPKKYRGLSHKIVAD